MKLFEDDLAIMFPDFFDHTISFDEVTKTQDSTGELTNQLAPVDGLQGLKCAVGNKPKALLQTQTSNSGIKEDLIRVLIPGHYPSIQVGMHCTIDGTDEHKVDQVQPNQSHDVTEVQISWWY